MWNIVKENERKRKHRMLKERVNLQHQMIKKQDELIQGKHEQQDKVIILFYFSDCVDFQQLHNRVVSGIEWHILYFYKQELKKQTAKARSQKQTFLVPQLQKGMFREYYWAFRAKSLYQD